MSLAKILWQKKIHNTSITGNSFSYDRYFLTQNTLEAELAGFMIKKNRI